LATGKFSGTMQANITIITMDEQKQKIIERVNQAQNILVTVSANPSVDQLASAIGLTLVLNQMDKHATAVFSGAVPSTIEFLKPEDTLEKNTDSLRDFIIALDKSKADKLRYKVEDQVVRIFITPYKTSLSEKDLDFSQGDFNVDVVICLGVNEQEDLDKAITAHGRILHDATIVSISTTGQGSLGSINWVDPQASSLSEMMVGLTSGLDKKALNNQVATALLTGIVASTERFRGDNTTPKTMSAAAELMAAGANQQLIATELETPPEPAAGIQTIDESGNSAAPSGEPQSIPEHKAEPGTLEINHEAEQFEEAEGAGSPLALEKPDEPAPEPQHPQIHVDDNGELLMADQLPAPEKLPEISHVHGVASDGTPTDSDGPAGRTEVHRQLLTNNTPQMDTGSLTANTEPEQFDLPTEELTLPAVSEPLLSHNESVLPSSAAPLMPPAVPAPSQPAWSPPPMPSEPYAPVWSPAPAQSQPAAPSFQPEPPTNPLTPAPTSPTPAPVNDDETLAEIEQAVDSPHLHMGDGPAPAADASNSAGSDGVDSARSAVEAALNNAADSNPLSPIAALNAQPLGPELHPTSVPEQSSGAPYTPPTDLFAPAPAAPMTPSSIPNMGFSEPTPGNTPADSALDMPLPTGGFGQPAPSAFPGTPAPAMGGQTPPPPVPPPMFPPVQ